MKASFTQSEKKTICDVCHIYLTIENFPVSGSVVVQIVKELKFENSIRINYPPEKV